MMTSFSPPFFYGACQTYDRLEPETAENELTSRTDQGWRKAVNRYVIAELSWPLRIKNGTKWNVGRMW